MQKKKIKIIRENFFEIFFFDFPNFFSVEIFHMMSTLRMQNYTIIGRGVPEIQGVTHTQRNYFSNIDLDSFDLIQSRRKKQQNCR